MTDRPAQCNCAMGADVKTCDVFERDEGCFKCGHDEVCHAPAAPPERPGEADREGNPRIYPCAECGTMRSRPEGGTTFTVCDGCWDKTYPTPAPPADVANERPGEEVRMTPLCFELVRRRVGAYCQLRKGHVGDHSLGTSDHRGCSCNDTGAAMCSRCFRAGCGEPLGCVLEPAPPAGVAGPNKEGTK